MVLLVLGVRLVQLGLVVHARGSLEGLESCYEADFLFSDHLVRVQELEVQEALEDLVAQGGLSLLGGLVVPEDLEDQLFL